MCVLLVRVSGHARRAAPRFGHLDRRAHQKSLGPVRLPARRTVRRVPRAADRGRAGLPRAGGPVQPGSAAPRGVAGRRATATLGRPWTTRSRPSPTPSASASAPTSPTSTGPCSRSSTCRRRSRARCSRGTRATRARCGGCSWTSSPTICPTPAAAPRSGRGQAGGRSCTSASSSATATTRWRSSAAPTSPASGSRTCSRRSSSARGWAPTWSSRRATSPTTRRCPDPPGGYRYYRDPALGPDYARAMDELFGIYSDALPRVCAWAEQRVPARRRRAGGRARARDQGQGARSAPRAAARELAVAHGHLRHRPDL